MGTINLIELSSVITYSPRERMTDPVSQVFRSDYHSKLPFVVILGKGSPNPQKFKELLPKDCKIVFESKKALNKYEVHRSTLGEGRNTVMVVDKND